MSNHENETMISNWTPDEVAAFDRWLSDREADAAYRGPVDPWADLDPRVDTSEPPF